MPSDAGLGATLSVAQIHSQPVRTEPVNLMSNSDLMIAMSVNVFVVCLFVLNFYTVSVCVCLTLTAHSHLGCLKIKCFRSLFPKPWGKNNDPAWHTWVNKLVKEWSPWL